MPRMDIDPPQRVKDALNRAHAAQVEAEKERVASGARTPVTVQRPQRILDLIIASDVFAELVEAELADPVEFGRR